MSPEVAASLALATSLSRIWLEKQIELNRLMIEAQQKNQPIPLAKLRELSSKLSDTLAAIDAEIAKQEGEA